MRVKHIGSVTFLIGSVQGEIMFGAIKSDKSKEKGLDMTNNNNNNNNISDSKEYTPLDKQKDVDVNEKCGILTQCMVTCAVMMSSAGCGMPVGYSAILLPQLSHDNETIHIDDEQGSWIASIHSAATPFGSILSGILMDAYGRRFTLQVASFPLIIGWFLIGFSPNYLVLLLGRFIAGLSTGLTAATGQVLVGEITQPHLRGILCSLPFASYSFGILLVYTFGYFLPWRYVAVLSAVLPILSLLLFFFLPESPIWLMRHGRLEEAKQALTWLRGGNVNMAKEEATQIMERMEADQKGDSKIGVWRTLLRPEVLKPFVIMNMFNLLQILSGTYLVVFYAVDMLKQVESISIDKFLAAVWTAMARFVFTIVAIFMLSQVGRRSLALTSGIGTSIAALIFASFEYLNCQKSGQFAAFSILIYVAVNTVGFMILPGVLIGELFPARIRGFAGGLSFTIFHFAMFVSAKIFPLIRQTIGISGVFCIFGISSTLASIFLYLMLPETKGKTLGEIEDYFRNKNVFWITRKNKNCGDR
ncbi:facilitated trehalose transporter Tret1-like isoform X1 [Harmonia axyridis]|uniref:facilitated trehalose transporter Tret1-like isoform X1 n=2 Tax=Harmonia axyridis TaxID=115357 RepID=UPI001E27694A|nr:facilitated trehalose transporter Tret1-like isoform X1 [Harmonia axyridis]